ncbi:hypothetical protein [Mesomycoplasma hyopneumoniae]|nr:hypothetical protein [Mesomycoplasma hyopneumoniae]
MISNNCKSQEFSWVSQFDGKNSLFSEYEYAEIPVNRCFLPVKP